MDGSRVLAPPPPKKKSTGRYSNTKVPATSLFPCCPATFFRYISAGRLWSLLGSSSLPVPIAAKVSAAIVPIIPSRKVVGPVILMRALIIIVVTMIVLRRCVSSVVLGSVVALKRIVGFATVTAGISILSGVAPSTAPETPSSSSTAVLDVCSGWAYQLVAVESATVAVLGRHWFEAHGSINEYSIDLRNILAE